MVPVFKNVWERFTDLSYNTGAIDVKMDGSVLEENLSLKMLGLTFSSKLDWGSYIISIGKTASRKIGALILSMKFLSPEVALYLYKSIIQQRMKYCCYVWVGAPNCLLEFLDKLQRRIYRTVGLSLADSLEPLVHCQNVASWVFSIGITLVDVHLNWLNWFHCWAFTCWLSWTFGSSLKCSQLKSFL